MISKDTVKHLLDLCAKPAALGGWLGLPYETDGCAKFVVKFYREMGIELTEEALKEARNFHKVEQPEFGDVVVFHDLPFRDPFGAFHVGVMLDRFRAVQCAHESVSNGVGVIVLGLFPFTDETIKGFYRHRACS